MEPSGSRASRRSGRPQGAATAAPVDSDGATGAGDDALRSMSATMRRTMVDAVFSKQKGSTAWTRAQALAARSRSP